MSEISDPNIKRYSRYVKFTGLPSLGTADKLKITIEVELL